VSDESIKELQKSLNTVRAIAKQDDENAKLAILTLMLDTTKSIVDEMRQAETERAVPKTKTKIKRVPIPQTKVITKPSKQQPNSDDNEQEPKDMSTQTPQPSTNTAIRPQ
jgi:hypothetical protein